eukprot:scaffold574_cov92-Isochrysis_galbana.AAC.6
MQFIAPPHRSSSSYSPRTSTSRCAASASDAPTVQPRKRVEVFHSASRPMDACHDSTGAPTDAMVSATSRTRGRQKSHAPSSRPAAEAGTRIRATGCSSSSRSTPRDAGASAYANHSAPSARSTSSSRPASDAYWTDQSSPRVAEVKRKLPASSADTAASHADQSASSAGELVFLRAGVASLAGPASAFLGSSGDRPLGFDAYRSMGQSAGGLASSSCSSRARGESSLAATPPGSSAPSGLMPRADCSPPSRTHIGMAAASLASKSRGARRGSVTGAMSTCSGHARQQAREAVAPHLTHRTTSGAMVVRPSEAHMRAEPAACASSSDSGVHRGSAWSSRAASRSPTLSADATSAGGAPPPVELISPPPPPSAGGGASKARSVSRASSSADKMHVPTMVDDMALPARSAIWSLFSRRQHLRTHNRPSAVGEVGHHIRRQARAQPRPHRASRPVHVLRQVPHERLVVGVLAAGSQPQEVDVHQIEHPLHLRLEPVVPGKVGAGAVALRFPGGQRPLGAQLLLDPSARVPGLAPAPVDHAPLLAHKKGLERSRRRPGQLVHRRSPPRQLLVAHHGPAGRRRAADRRGPPVGRARVERKQVDAGAGVRDVVVLGVDAQVLGRVPFFCVVLHHRVPRGTAHILLQHDGRPVPPDPRQHAPERLARLALLLDALLLVVHVRVVDARRARNENIHAARHHVAGAVGSGGLL